MKIALTILSLMVTASTSFAYDITFTQEKQISGDLGQKCTQMTEKEVLDKIISEMGISTDKVLTVEIVRCFDVTAPRETISAPILTIKVQHKK